MFFASFPDRCVQMYQFFIQKCQISHCSMALIRWTMLSPRDTCSYPKYKIASIALLIRNEGLLVFAEEQIMFY